MNSEVKSKPSVFHVTSEEEFNDIIKKATENKIVVFAKFGAVWCGPCKRIQPFYEKLAAFYPNGIFLSIDTDKVSKVAMSYSVSSLPTFLVFQNGKYAVMLKGANPQRLKEMVGNHLAVV
jgi:thioredoxin 1